MLSDFLDQNRRAQASYSLPSEVRHYSAKQLFRMRLPDGIVVEFNTEHPEALALQMVAAARRST